MSCYFLLESTLLSEIPGQLSTLFHCINPPISIKCPSLPPVHLAILRLRKKDMFSRSPIITANRKQRKSKHGSFDQEHLKINENMTKKCFISSGLRFVSNILNPPTIICIDNRNAGCNLSIYHTFPPDT